MVGCFIQHPTFSQVIRAKGKSTNCGKSTSKIRITTHVSKNGKIPLTSSSILIFPIPQITFNTVPTGGVIKPMDVFITKRTPKYTGSIPACLIKGTSTGVITKIVGVKSIAVPMINISNINVNINKVWLYITGASSSVNCAGISAAAISHAETDAAATGNIITAVVLAALSINP